MRAWNALLPPPRISLRWLWSAASFGGAPARARLTAAADGAALFGSSLPQPAATSASTSAMAAIRMHAKRGTGASVTVQTAATPALGALIVISELLKLAPAPLEMQGFPKRRQ